MSEKTLKTPEQLLGELKVARARAIEQIESELNRPLTDFETAMAKAFFNDGWIAGKDMLMARINAV